jgi:NAD(P)-dependent dehydrogenase (short-subunit alcohol dehydrogenase family)
MLKFMLNPAFRVSIIYGKFVLGGQTMDFHGKVAVITGGAGGIGRCIAESFLDKGALVAVIDTDAAHGARMKEKYGDKLLFFIGDVGEAKDTFVEAALSRFPEVHCRIPKAIRRPRAASLR